ncbi:putative guanylate kinase [Schistosoma mansoni]|uniref:putative guanylate kinase n=1 Tax=Schistosoma mansoni TaxID=6183 RepID=UPI0001A638B7|nr:putative guanylate kinase [Schistosoma mansoni]|eukprot:XP_018650830.1 putative guanylate kinase [Schistosoma mansoni]
MSELNLELKRPVVICGPSGCGKSTCIRMLINKYPNSFRYCVSHTTRPRRPDEIHTRDYNFVSKEEFDEAISKDEFIEYVMFSGHYYGTSKSELKKAELEKRVCLMDVDIQGVEKLQKTNINPICIFIRPRTFAILPEVQMSHPAYHEVRSCWAVDRYHQRQRMVVSNYNELIEI